MNKPPTHHTLVSYLRITFLAFATGICSAFILSTTKAADLAFVPQIIALEGDVAPGTDGATFIDFFPPVQSDSGSVVFLAEVTGPAGNSRGIWLWDGISLAVIVRAGDSTSKKGSTFNGMGPPTINAFDEISFNADIGCKPGQHFSSIWKVEDGQFNLIAIAGDPAPGTNTTFRDFSGTTIRPAIADTRDVAFFANLTSDGPQNSSLWSTAPPSHGPRHLRRARCVGPQKDILRTSQDATLRLVANDGDVAPGTLGDTFDGFFAPEMSSFGDIAFLPGLTSLGGNRGGVWVDDAMGLLVPVAIQGETAPGTGGQTFSSRFDHVVINDQGLTAFEASFGIPRNAGLWREGAGGLELVLKDGDIVDETTGETFNDPFPLKFGDAGELIFHSAIVSGNTDFGLFGLDASGTLELIVRDGDFLQVDINDFREIDRFFVYQAGSQNFIGDFDVPIAVNFTDNSSGLFVISNITPEVPM